MLDYINHKYKIDTTRSIVLANYQTRYHILKSRSLKLSANDGKRHLVYCGNTDYGEIKRSRKLFLELTYHSIHLHIYPTDDKK